MMKSLRSFIKTAFVVGAILFTLIYIANQWQQIEPHLDQINWSYIALAGVIFILNMIILPLGVVLLFHFMDMKAALPDIYYAYSVSQISKYLPGSVWALPGRVFLYKDFGIPTATGINSLIAELLLMIAAAALISLIGLSQNVPQLQIVMGLILVGTLIFIVIMKFARQQLLLLTWLPPKLITLIGKIDWDLSFKHSLILVIFYALTWLLFGFAFELVVAAVGAPLEQPIYFAGLFAGAWTLGFVTIISPGGIGIREAVLVTGVSLFVSSPLPVVVAVLSRILWIVAELVSLGFASLIHWNMHRQTKYTQLSSHESL